LLRSKRAHATGKVLWKGRTYSDKPGPDKGPSNSSESDKILATGN
jgi:hypothetical protein